MENQKWSKREKLYARRALLRRELETAEIFDSVREMKQIVVLTSYDN